MNKISLNRLNNSLLQQLCLVLGLFILVFYSLSAEALAAQWQLSKQGNGIKVFVKDNENSVIKSFRGEVLINSRLTPLVAILEDTESFPRWMYETKGAKKLKEINQTSSYVYVVSDMPWPVADRDSITLANLTQNKKSKQVQIAMKSSPNYIKNKRGIVRIKDMQGRWVLKPQGKNKTKVTYEMRVDPGGNIPKWLVNALSVDMPFYTLDNLRREVKLAKYQNAKRAYILK